MKFQFRTKVDLDDFFGSPPPNELRETLFKFAYESAFMNVADDLSIMDKSVPRPDQKKRIEILKIIKAASKSYFYNLAGEKCENCNMKLKKFVESLVDLSLALIAIDHEPFFKRKVIAATRASSHLFRSLLSRSPKRMSQHVGSIVDFFKIFKSDCNQVYVDSLSETSKKNIEELARNAGPILVNLKYLNWDSRQGAERLHRSYEFLCEEIGSERAQSLVYSLLNRLEHSGFHLSPNASTWLNRAKHFRSTIKKPKFILER